MSYLRDTQSQGEESQDLFDGEAVTHAVQSGSVSVPILLQEILKEQKKLNDKFDILSSEVKTLKFSMARNKPAFVVESSNIEKEFVTWLKEKFSLNPWLNTKEAVVQAEMKQILNRAGVTDSSAGQKMASYAATRFTYYRNQIRTKLTSNTVLDIEGLSLGQLHNHLWKHFLPTTVSIDHKERRQLTIMLRSFCSKNEHFKSHCSRFWGDFELYYEKIQVDQSQDKWEKMEEREERRILRYVQLSES